MKEITIVLLLLCVCFSVVEKRVNNDNLPQISYIVDEHTHTNDAKVETISDYANVNHIRRNSPHHIDIAIRVNAIDYQR